MRLDLSSKHAFLGMVSTALFVAGLSEQYFSLMSIGCFSGSVVYMGLCLHEFGKHRRGRPLIQVHESETESDGMDEGDEEMVELKND